MSGCKVCIIGTGNMGGAFAEALSKNQALDLYVYDSYAPCAKALAQGKNMTVLPSMDKATGFDVVIIAVKPQVLPSIWEDLAALKPGFFISIAAGVTLEKLQTNLKTCKVVRFMPNIAAKIGAAVTAVAYSKDLNQQQKDCAMDIALAVGSAFELEENLFSAFIGISGSGIAYMLEFMQKATGKNAADLEAMVCSAKGTTIEGIKALDEAGFAAAVINAVSAAAKRSEELEKKA